MFEQVSPLALTCVPNRMVMATMAKTKRVENIILKATTIAFASPKNLTRQEHNRSKEVRDGLGLCCERSTQISGSSKLGNLKEITMGTVFIL
jgi:hypothetical protein